MLSSENRPQKRSTTREVDSRLSRLTEQRRNGRQNVWKVATDTKHIAFSSMLSPCRYANAEETTTPIARSIMIYRRSSRMQPRTYPKQNSSNAVASLIQCESLYFFGGASSKVGKQSLRSLLCLFVACSVSLVNSVSISGMEDRRNITQLHTLVRGLSSRR